MISIKATLFLFALSTIGQINSVFLANLFPPKNSNCAYVPANWYIHPDASVYAGVLYGYWCGGANELEWCYPSSDWVGDNTTDIASPKLTYYNTPGTRWAGIQTLNKCGVASQGTWNQYSVDVHPIYNDCYTHI